MFVEEHKRISFRNARVIVSPLRNVFLRHDDADIPGLPGLEVDIHHNHGAIERKIAPLHLAYLTNPEASLIEHPDEGPVPAPAAGRQEGLHLFGCKEISGLVGHSILGRDMDPADLPLREIGIIVFDHPEDELPEDPDPVVLGILFECGAFLCETVLHRVNAGIDIGNREILIGTNEPPPSD